MRMRLMEAKIASLKRNSKGASHSSDDD
jgi:hypothetical protein